MVMYLYERDLGLNVEMVKRPLCLVCLNEWEGWHVLDRVVDAPVYQDVPTWDGCLPGNSEVSNFLAYPKSSTFVVPAMKKNVDYLLIAKPVAFNHSRIRCDCALFMQTRPVASSSL
jgi:hypothetical protein